MARVLIGLVGKKGSGKTTSANIIKKELDPVYEIQLAKKLKDVCSRVFKVNRDFMDDPVLKEVELDKTITITFWNIIKVCFYFLVFPKIKTFKHIGTRLTTARRLLQFVGTDILRQIDTEIHLKKAVSGLPKNGVFIVSDIRFKDEMEYLHKWAYPYGWFFYVERGIENKDFHASEIELDNLKKLSTRVINNVSNINNLENEIKASLTWVTNELPYIGYGPYKRQLERVKNQKWKSSQHYLLRKFYKFLDLF